MAKSMGLDGWMWPGGKSNIKTTAYCRLNQRPYGERAAEDVPGFRICNRISSREDGDSQFSTFFAYEQGDRQFANNNSTIPDTSAATNNGTETSTEGYFDENNVWVDTTGTHITGEVETTF